MSGHERIIAAMCAGGTCSAVAGWILSMSSGTIMPRILGGILAFAYPGGLLAMHVVLYVGGRKTATARERAWVLCGMITCAALFGAIALRLSMDLPYITVFESHPKTIGK